jgi:glycosyltransferase involved in cell wall biosynthesis
MILICVNELAGPTGYHKSVVETANALHRAGYGVAVLSFLGASDGAGDAMPRWPLDVGVPAFVLQTLPADGGRLLHRNVHPVLSGRVHSARYEFTANQLAALRQINAELSADDTVIFTTPLQALAFHRALEGDERRAPTVLQVHGDYLHHDELWGLVIEARDAIDRVQTVAEGLRSQFVPTFAEADVVFVPNLHSPSPLRRVEHEGVEIALPASFQHRKNQLDAVRALALVDDESVRLTLWGNINPLNPYFIAVRQLVSSLGLDHRVRTPGFGTESDVYSTADIVLMTSLSEGFGYPLLEAAYHRLPAVAYDFDFGPRDAIVDGETGFIVPVGDVEQLATRLTELAADETLRGRFGERARALFDERFATEAVVARYGELIGPPGGSAADLAELFSTDGGEPVRVEDVSHRYRRAGGRRLHQVTVSSPVPICDVRIDDGERVATPRVRRLPGATRIEFPASAGTEVVSYSTVPGSPDRHFLGSATRAGGLDVPLYLRRDAGYGDAAPPVQDVIFAASGGARRVAVRESTLVLRDFAARARGEVTRRLSQLTPGRPKTAPTGATPTGSSATSPATQPPPQRPGSSIARAAGLPVAALGSLRRVATTYGRTAVTALVLALATKPSAPTRREIARHPWFPVTSGVDSFGTAINQPGGVKVRNAGTAARPTVSIDGEYDWLLVRDGASQRRIESPFSYGELFDRICAAERDHGLFDITTRDGVHLWELGRSALVIQLAEALGLWGKATAIDGVVNDVYTGRKRLATAPPARRVVFDYARRGQGGYRTAPFLDDRTLFVVQPERDGYPEVDDTNLVYPFHEFNRWKQDWRRRWAHLRVPDVDARPFEEALSDALGMQVDLGDHLRNRLAKFLAERDFWTPVFERVQPEEVLIASSHWWAGISSAAARSGAQVSDIQYALTSRYAPSFWFGGTPHYGATRLYAWSELWAARTNVYKEHVIVPRQQPELQAAAQDGLERDPTWDVCVISQPRVLRRILAFVQELVRERPELRVVVAPHPAQRSLIDEELGAAGLSGRVTIAPDDTLTTIRRSAISVGTFSTSLWEAAALGRPTYVLPVPGHEETLQDVESGLFRIAGSPDDLVPYQVPETRRSIFGTA